MYTFYTISQSQIKFKSPYARQKETKRLPMTTGLACLLLLFKGILKVL